MKITEIGAEAKAILRSKDASRISRWLSAQQLPRSAAIYEGACERLFQKLPDECVDLVITSPPYGMGKAYESRSSGISDFVLNHQRILPEVCRLLKPGGSLCWQVGLHVQNGVSTPLDYLVYEIMRDVPEMRLRNRIAWTFGHGLHCRTRFSGRHETVLWFTKGDNYSFDLDAVRIPQKYPGKRHASGPSKGLPSGNPNGKNPGDVWEIPNVNSNHVEKTGHPCQFPVALVQRFIRALTKPGDLVFDPFCGVASTGVAAVVEGRRFVGAEVESDYVHVGLDRLRDARDGKAKFRPAEKAIHSPSPTSAVGRRPDHFASAAPLDEAVSD
ncbi:DNA-methyltransferase [Stenotrophomonas maltophilia]|uniref:DNA-methyltransferase n=1 Tax=Stenotrophomonas maltophilia TaxID=40324 RepID=UPI001658B0B0|nr:site-specific DNA-methyltransferase [Stenotrophomonas maltophilia]MBC9114608.1 site-specific DNA-methyltransferase [Stenotrophomonas maltophilia]